MREIKFRGLDYYGKWQYGNYSKKFLPSRDWTGKKTSEPSWVHYITDYEYDLIGVKPETIGQFTGLRDIKRNEIYEGDILRWHGIDNDGTAMQQNDEVFYKDGCFMVKNIKGKFPQEETLLDYLRYDFETIEVIGNIYETEANNEHI